MSGVDSEQDKQPISSANGKTIDIDAAALKKDTAEDHASSTDRLKGTAETETKADVSCESETTETKEDKAKDSQSPEIIANGESAEGHENGEVSEKVEESSLAEKKTEETPEEGADSKQVGGEVKAEGVESQVVETEKEVEKATEESIPDEKSNDTAGTTADGEQSGIETAPVEVEKTDNELKEETSQVDEKQAEKETENQASEESKVSVTDTEAADRKRAVTIDNPVDMSELTAKSGESPQKFQDQRSRTLGDIEGKASLPLKEDVAARSRTIWYTDEVEDTPSKPDSTETIEETVSYSTSIVGGVVHRVPINSSSPKNQHKAKEGSPQTSPSKKRSVIDSLFGRHKKSKGSPESPPRDTSNVKDAEKESEENQPEPSPVTPGSDADAAKSDTEASESVEGDATKGTDINQGEKVTADLEKKDEESEVKPEAAAQSEEGIREETAEAAQDSEMKESEVESHDVQEVPVPVEGVEEKGETSGESPKGEQSEETKDAVKRPHTDLPEEETTSPEPEAKKKKPIFGGIFTWRKKSKGDGAAPPGDTPQEKQDDKADEEAVEGGDTKGGTDQEVTPDTGDATAIAQQEVTEDTISPAEDQAVESAMEEIADKEEPKVETATEGEPSDNKQETILPEDVEKTADEPVRSKDTNGTADKEETDEKPQDSKPERKHSFLGGLFGRYKNKKSKDADASPPAEISHEKGDKVEEQGESMAAPPVDDAKTQAAEESGTDQSAPEPSGTAAPAQQEETEDAISPAVDQGVEGVKEETADTKEQEGDSAAGGEPSGKVEETEVPEDVHKSEEETSEPNDAECSVEKEETEEKKVQLEESQPEKKHSIFSGFFGRRKSKKSKDADASPPAETSQEKGDKVEVQDGSVEIKPADDAKPQGAESVKTVENEKDQSVAPETSDTTSTTQQEVTEDTISPAVDQAVESVKEETADKKEKEGETAAAAAAEEPSGKVEESEVPEDVKKSAEETSEPKDTEGTVEKQETEEKPVQSQESQPEKKHSIFSGLFARRKSKKAKGEVVTPPTEASQEKDGDKPVEEQQGEGVSTEPAGDTKAEAVEGVETDQGASPDISDATVIAQQQVAEDVISPAVDQAVESAKEVLTDEEKVDGNIEDKEATSVQEPSDKEVETAVPEDVKKSTEEKSEVQDKPRIEEPSEDASKATNGPSEPAVENATSPESETQDKDTALKERIALSQQGSHSPKTRRMQMRISYAETDGEGGREVEVIGTPERGPETAKQVGDRRVSCRSLGEADHEGWLAKKGGPLFFSSWKRKWVVLKEGKLYYFKTAFDPEASGIINMEGTTVAQPPETKKNFCFKCEQPGPKPQVSIFMADSKEDMEKWLTVLGAASRGETIHKSKQHHLTPRDEVVMRKKSGSISAQRTSSVLAVGGRHDFLEDEEDLKAIRRRSTPGSLSKPHIETEEEDKQPSVSSDTHPVISETQPVPSDTEPEPQESQEETEKSGEGATAEKPVPVVDEVLASSDQVVVESAAPVEVAPPEQETPAAEKSDDALPEVASQQEEKGSEEPASVSVEVPAEAESALPEQESAADASDSIVDRTDGAVSIVTTESSVSVVETVKTTSVVSEKVETVVSVVKTEVTEVSSAPQPPEEKVDTVVSVVKTEVTEVSSAQQPPEELKHDVKEDVKEVSPTKPDASAPLPSEPTSPSKTKWYFTLDQQETWSVPPEVEAEKSSSRQKLSSSGSDKGSIKSGKGSIKSASDDDLLIMCRNIREARLSIVGDHVWEGAERLRALSSVHDDNEEAFVRLKTLERTLKDKEKHLSELEELLTQPEINRESIYAWKLRYSDLVEELFPQDAEDVQEKGAENAAEGGEGETQDQKHSEVVKEEEKLKSSEAEGSDREVKDKISEEVKEETSEEVKDSPDEVREEIPTEVEKKSDEEVAASSSKEEDKGKVDGKQEAPERKQKHEEDQEIIKEEQPPSEKQEETKEIETDNLAVIAQTEQTPVESAPVADSERIVQEAETIQEGEISRQKPSESQEVSGEQEDSEDALDTHL